MVLLVKANYFSTICVVSTKQPAPIFVISLYLSLQRRFWIDVVRKYSCFGRVKVWPKLNLLRLYQLMWDAIWKSCCVGPAKVWPPKLTPLTSSSLSKVRLGTDNAPLWKSNILASQKISPRCAKDIARFAKEISLLCKNNLPALLPRFAFIEVY